MRKCLRNSPFEIKAPIAPPTIGEMHRAISIGTDISPESDLTYSADIPFCWICVKKLSLYTQMARGEPSMP